MAEANSFLDFRERFDALQREAHVYGVASLCVLVEINPLAQKETRWWDYTGSETFAIGMATLAQSQLLGGK
jgi:hypothetical protein